MLQRISESGRKKDFKASGRCSKANDPFDRILLSQAKAENMVFMPRDSLIPYYGERCIMSV